MHPLIRILTLLALAVLVPWLPLVPLLAMSLLLFGWGAIHPATGVRMWRGVMRLRWLLFSLTVLYLWFSPGEPLFPQFGRVSPTAEGAMLALTRTAVLLVMVCAATGLLANVPAHDVSAALRGLLAWPVRTETGTRFADRVGFLLASLPKVEQQVRTNLRHDERALADRAAALFLGIETTAVALPPAPPSSPLAPVPRWQWLLPCMPLALLVPSLVS